MMFLLLSLKTNLYPESRVRYRGMYLVRAVSDFRDHTHPNSLIEFPLQNIEHFYAGC